MGLAPCAVETVPWRVFGYFLGGSHGLLGASSGLLNSWDSWIACKRLLRALGVIFFCCGHIFDLSQGTWKSTGGIPMIPSHGISKWTYFHNKFKDSESSSFNVTRFLDKNTWVCDQKFPHENIPANFIESQWWSFEMLSLGVPKSPHRLNIPRCLICTSVTTIQRILSTHMGTHQRTQDSRTLAHVFAIEGFPPWISMTLIYECT